MENRIFDVSSREGIIADIQANLETLSAREVSNYSVMLSALLARLGEQLAVAERAYYQRWEIIRLNVETDGRAERKAKATEEYYQRRLLDAQFKSTKELIMSLKKRLEVLMDEEREQRYAGNR
jgi:hypothetical protein